PYLRPHQTHTPVLFLLNASANSTIYTLSLHDALPISLSRHSRTGIPWSPSSRQPPEMPVRHYRVFSIVSAVFLSPCLSPFPFRSDRKSTRLNSSHVSISYAVFCLKKKKNTSCYMTHLR